MTLNKKSHFRNIILAGFLLIAIHSLAQPDADLVVYRNKYPTSAIVRLNSELNVDIKLENDEIGITQNFLNTDLYLNETASMFSKGSVSHSGFFQLQKIEASSFNLNNGKYQENKVSEFREKDELSGYFHDDIKSLNFIYPNLGPGSKSRLYTEEKITNPRFLNVFFFGGYFPFIHSKLTITVDKDIEMVFKEYHTDSLKLKFTKTEKRNRIIYQWESANVDPIKMEDGTPDLKNYYPHIVPIITSYKTSAGKTINLARDISGLYDWYYSLISNINQKTADEDLVKLVNELTKDKKSELEKVRAIYYWVQKNIKYIAFEFGLGGFIPREANDIFRKKYGDCKDNASILHEMLKIAGIKGYYTWIGTRDIPYKYNELPCPMVDNHMILAYQDGGKIYFLDATGRYMPLEMPTAFIQGKDALVGKGEGKFDIVEVPVVAAEQNAEKDSSFLRIEGKSLVGSGLRTYSGYQKVDIFNNIESLNTDKQIKTCYNGLLQKGNNKFTIGNYQEMNKFDYDKNFMLKYDYSIPDYIVAKDDEIYLNLNIDKIILPMKIEENRKTDIEQQYKRSYTYTNIFQLPDGYALEYLPENLDIRNDFLTVSISYEKKDNKVIYNHKVTFDKLILKKPEQKAFMEQVKKVEKAYKGTIVLKEIKK